MYNVGTSGYWEFNNYRYVHHGKGLSPLATFTTSKFHAYTRLHRLPWWWLTAHTRKIVTVFPVPWTEQILTSQVGSPL